MFHEVIERSRTYFVEDVTDIGLALTEPHGQELGTLDGDEIGLALVGNGLGQQGLTTSRRAVEEHTTRGLHAKLQELLGMLHRVLNQLLKLLLDLLQASDVIPTDIGRLHDGFTNGRWRGFGHGKAEVLHGHGQGVQDLGVDRFILQVDEIHLFTDLLQGSL